MRRDLWNSKFNHREIHGAPIAIGVTENTGRGHFNELSGRVIGMAIEVHKALGPGLLESCYKECLYHKIVKSGLRVEKENPLPLIFEEVKLECGYRIDLLVENKILIEIKSVEALNDIQLAQTLTYIKLGKFKLGLLINFNVIKLTNGVKRILNGTL